MLPYNVTAMCFHVLAVTLPPGEIFCSDEDPLEVIVNRLPLKNHHHILGWSRGSSRAGCK